MFTLNLQSNQPIYEQLYNNVLKLICINILKPGEKLPSVRSLATDLAINPNTVARAYQMLEQNNIIYSVVGKGSFISDSLSVANEIKKSAKEKILNSLDEAVKANLTQNEILTIISEYFSDKKI